MEIKFQKSIRNNFTLKVIATAVSRYFKTLIGGLRTFITFSLGAAMQVPFLLMSEFLQSYNCSIRKI